MKELSKDELLVKFMKEFFPFTPFYNCGFFTKEMKGDYKAQAERICQYFGYKSVFEYGKDEIRVHLSYAGARPMHVNKEGELIIEPFVTTIPSIYEN